MTGSAVPASVAADLAAAARDYLRVADGVEAALLERLAAAAVLLAEQYCGRVLVGRSFTEVLPASFGWRRLAWGPVMAIEGVVTANGAALPIEAYAVDIDASGDGWIRVVDGARVSVSYAAGVVAGFAALPAPVAQGCVLLVAHLFGDRGGGAPPAAVAALWRPFRRLRLGDIGR